MVRNRGLGRGMSALLGEKQGPASHDPSATTDTLHTVKEEDGGTRTVPIRSISANPFQPRSDFDPETLQELATSLKNHGMLEPLLVRADPSKQTSYQLIAGERRLRAAKAAGLEQVPVLVHEATDQELLEIAIVENVQREDLNPIEEAQAYRRLMQASAAAGTTLTQQEVADKVGKSRVGVANLLRLLDLPVYIQESIQAGKLSQGHGKILAGLPEADQRRAWKFATEQEASVRLLEEFLTKEKGSAKEAAPARSKTKEASTAERDPNLVALEEALQERLRTKVHFVRKKDGSGHIQIDFFGREDLDRLLESLDIEL